MCDQFWFCAFFALMVQINVPFYPMTTQWLSGSFDLFFLMIINLKRSIDRRWLFKSVVTLIIRWSCFRFYFTVEQSYKMIIEAHLVHPVSKHFQQLGWLGWIDDLGRSSPCHPLPKYFQQLGWLGWEWDIWMDWVDTHLVILFQNTIKY